jgi:hypothetical protein
VRKLLSKFRSFVGSKVAPTQTSGRSEPTEMSRQAAVRQFERTQRQLAKRNEQLARRDKELTQLRAQLASLSDGTEAASGVWAENIIWVFCYARSGSTWLSAMMGDIEGHGRWNEPLVGALFGDFYYGRYGQDKAPRAPKDIMAQQYRTIWLRSIRSMVLEGATARYPELSGGNGYLTIKEPHGSVGAPLLAEALPESRVIFLVRDPRDAVASGLDAQSKGSWTSKNPKWKGKKPQTEADKDPDTFVKQRVERYMQHVGNAKNAFEAHQGYKVLVRYEDLRADTLGTMKRIYSHLEVPVSEEELARVVEKHAWENIPEEKKGQGKFYRKATPGGWQEDLTLEQAETIEEITTPLLDELYPGWTSVRSVDIS